MLGTHEAAMEDDGTDVNKGYREVTILLHPTLNNISTTNASQSVPGDVQLCSSTIDKLMQIAKKKMQIDLHWQPQVRSHNEVCNCCSTL